MRTLARLVHGLAWHAFHWTSPFALAALLAAYATALLYLPAQAQERSRDARRLVELVAKVSMNEALDSYPDLALIWQITEGHGTSDGERAAWLSSHSACVSGRLPEHVAETRPGNCAWTRTLRPNDSQPAGWPHSRQAWLRVVPRWLAHLGKTRDFVDGVDPYRPCRETPDTWDGDVPSWRARAAARGYREADCDEGARNIGYVYVGREGGA